MCTVTGKGEATNRALFAVISGLPISSFRRTAPARTGMRLSAISPTGASHWVAALLPRGAERLVLGKVAMLAVTSVMVRLPTTAAAPDFVTVVGIVVSFLGQG